VDLSKQRRRLFWALGATGVCAIVAAAGIVGSFMTRLEWPLSLAIAAIVVGVLAQVWFIVGVVRDRAG
jgi:hypothetical protein